MSQTDKERAIGEILKTSIVLKDRTIGCAIVESSSEAYDAGYIAAKEDAAKAAATLMAECTAISDLRGHKCEVDCESVKALAAEIRKLKPEEK